MIWIILYCPSDVLYGPLKVYQRNDFAIVSMIEYCTSEYLLQYRFVISNLCEILYHHTIYFDTFRYVERESNPPLETDES